jgi:hypothetical protein
MTKPGRVTKRPPRWLRIVAGVATVLYSVQLIPNHEPQDVLKVAALAPLFLLFAIAPPGLFDGRFEAWTRRHPLARSAFTFVFFGALCLSGLAELLDWGPALAITLPLSAIVVAVVAYVSRRAQDT